MNPVTRLPEGVELSCELACGPLVSVWATWDGPGRPAIADPVERLHAAHRAWVLAGQQWSMAQGASRNAWIALLSQDVLDQVSVAGRERGEELAKRVWCRAPDRALMAARRRAAYFRAWGQ